MPLSDVALSCELQKEHIKSFTLLATSAYRAHLLFFLGKAAFLDFFHKLKSESLDFVALFIGLLGFDAIRSLCDSRGIGLFIRLFGLGACFTDGWGLTAVVVVLNQILAFLFVPGLVSGLDEVIRLLQCVPTSEVAQFLMMNMWLMKWSFVNADHCCFIFIDRSHHDAVIDDE